MSDARNDSKNDAKYEEVLARLSERIDSGYYFRDGRDGRMETVDQMLAEFGVGKTTLRFALAILKDRGVVRSHQGKSWFVVASSASRGSFAASADEDRTNGSTET